MAQPPQANAASTVILLVDDAASIRKLGQCILERQGFTTLTAESGTEALAIYTEHHRRIDLVILDLTMPGLSGLETWKRLRDVNSAVRVIIASGYSEDAIAEEEAVSPESFIAKPFAPEALVEAVRNALGGAD
jgi:CheY-like chemotaxis protein